MFELTNFDALQIGLASPEKIREWSHGEVKKPETINYRTLKPERDGLFCERIFGPTKDWECQCGRYKRVRYKGVICEKCGVEVTRAKVRRERMGHIELAAPVSHIWYFKGIPCRMKMLLDMSPRALEKVLYFASFVVTDPGKTPLMYKQILTDKEYRDAQAEYGAKAFKAGMGAEAIKALLKDLKLTELGVQLRKEIAESSGQKRANAIKRLEVIEAFIKSGNKPEWIIMDVIPVIPPELRPMVQLDGGRFATSDLNDLYRRVINRNNRLKRLLELRAPDIIVRNEKRMLQEAVDALIDNGRRGRPVTGPGNRALKSLSDMLRGKQGRFRQNLLGKRVDYSGRSVIVVGPELKMYQCGLPKEMALELFKPFVMKKLVEDGLAHNIKSAKRMVERVRPEVWDELEVVIQDHPVLLNRAPTLHRLGIQAFEPILVEGRAIKLHPLVCTAFNADFDGDQMAVHVPLSVEAQAEARFLMLASNNILKPQSGLPVVEPDKDMVIGCYYLTLQRDGDKGEGKIFSSENEAVMAYQTGDVTLHAKVKVRIEREWHGEKRRKVVETSIGRLIFNNAIPQDLGFVDRTKEENLFTLEVDKMVVKKDLKAIADRCYRRYGTTVTSEVLDNIKELGFRYSTLGGISVGFQDMVVPEEKKAILDEAEKKVADVDELFHDGMLSEQERRAKVIEIWSAANVKVTDALMATLKSDNPIFMMSNSGARGSKNQISQLGGMRGLMADPSGQIIEVPIRANFREGLTVLEFFISSHGARKGLADTALRTADSGYLTRRLVDVSQDVIVREEDCFAVRGEVPKGMPIEALMDGNKLVEGFGERILGRYAVDAVVHPHTGEVLCPANEMITYDRRDRIVAAGITSLNCRSVFTCRSEHGICAKCYGANMATGGEVNIGEAVGIIAAQAIGEPGTQLTMRTFHTGGVASAEDITQ
ncbi:MAG TPA: DNA-directed RNA polymerase subunit beta', partial [Clostridia bacterium]|nr:DNA-directed RNA polymerase subunit beta' [Clostridia bacterium]